jgi:hypothetical protein
MVGTTDGPITLHQGYVLRPTFLRESSRLLVEGQRARYALHGAYPAHWYHKADQRAESNVRIQCTVP